MINLFPVAVIMVTRMVTTAMNNAARAEHERNKETENEGRTEPNDSWGGFRPSAQASGQMPERKRNKR